MGVFLSPLVAESQVGRVGVVEVECREGVPQGDLGISGLDCRGECTLTMNERGEEQAWSFTVEPRINGINRDGPAQGKLRRGDVLVAIDGVPITTRDGGVRYANVEPGQEVELMVRREGDLRRVTIRAGSVCPPPPPKPLSPAPLLPRAEVLTIDTASAPLPGRGVAVGRLAPPPPPDTSVAVPRRALGIAVSPRVVVAPERTPVAVAEGIASRGVVAATATASAGLLAGNSPTGRLGIGFQCKECGTRTDEVSNEEIWFFSGPLEVTAVNSGGPADEAGIRRGDFIKAIDGRDIDTDEGGLAYTRIKPGEPVRLTVIKRNGSEVEVSLIPEEPTRVGLVRGRAVVPEPSGVALATPESAIRPSTVTPVRPGLPDRVDVPTPVAEMEPPPDMPLRYSGAVNGVEIEVRGEPVSVSEFKGTRTLYINADGIWIKIRVPREILIRGGGVTELESFFRR
jgi:S1-C subfamily serine protease